MALFIEQLKRWQETGGREWHAVKGPRPGLDPGLLQHRQSLCTWDACSTNWAKWRPLKNKLLNVYKIRTIILKMQVIALQIWYLQLVLHLLYASNPIWTSEGA